MIDIYKYIDKDMDKSFRPFVYEGIGKGLNTEVCLRALPYERATFFLNKINREYQRDGFRGFGDGH